MLGPRQAAVDDDQQHGEQYGKRRLGDVLDRQPRPAGAAHVGLPAREPALRLGAAGLVAWRKVRNAYLAEHADESKAAAAAKEAADSERPKASNN